MNLISGIGALGGLAQGAANLVKELRRPRLKSEDFAALVQAEVAKTRQQTAREAEPAARADQFSAQFMTHRDVNADGVVNFKESGLARDMFDRLDTDGNGALSRAEVRHGYLDQLNAHATNTATQHE